MSDGITPSEKCDFSEEKKATAALDISGVINCEETKDPY
jgi:hypothetical protein